AATLRVPAHESGRSRHELSAAASYPGHDQRAPAASGGSRGAPESGTSGRPLAGQEGSERRRESKSESAARQRRSFAASIASTGSGHNRSRRAPQAGSRPDASASAAVRSERSQALSRDLQQPATGRADGRLLVQPLQR